MNSDTGADHKYETQEHASLTSDIRPGKNISKRLGTADQRRLQAAVDVDVFVASSSKL